jgi:hypothetical protein
MIEERGTYLDMSDTSSIKVFKVVGPYKSNAKRNKMI